MRYASYNPFALDLPPEPEHLPALPQVRPYPWNLPSPFNQIHDPSPAERERWRADFRQVRHAREVAFERIEREHRAKEAYVEKTRCLSRTIFSLSDQGLIETAESQAIYSVHPRIKERALAVGRAHYADELAELEQALATSYVGPRPLGAQVTSLDDLRPFIQRMAALSKVAKYADAIREYQNRLNPGLFNLGEWALMIELLEPILPHIDDQDIDPSRACFVLTQLAHAYSLRHNLQTALECYKRALNPHYHDNPSSFARAMSNYGLCLVENGHLAQAERAYELALDWADASEQPWVQLRQLTLALKIGNRTAASAHLQACRAARPSSQLRRVWEARLALAEARVALLHGDPAAEQHLHQAIQLSAAPGAMSAAPAYTHLARLYLEQGHYDQAAAAVQQAQQVAVRDGVSRVMLTGLEARILSGLGKPEAARREVEIALQLVTQGDVSEQAQILADAAELYLAWGEAESAAGYVRRGLELAWPTGEPRRFAQPFRQLKPLIATLDINWQPAPARESEPLPFEQEITTDVQQARTLSKASPHKQDSCYIGAFEWMQIGAVACFGVNDERLIRRVTGKLARLSWEPKNLTISHMGEKVPPPSNTPDGKRIIQVGERREFTELRFSHEEELAFDRLFVIIGIIGRNADDELAHAYINCRVDRLHTLLKEADNSARSFNISEYATLVACDAGLPDSAIREKLRRDYLFGEQVCNVRIFPPLSEVT
jgi:tetratricopeptide (TPR) repeat protein